jgi:putative tricarboxylic transport membrane protein
MGGTGSKQEDQIITVLLEKAAGKKMTYVPFKGGGDVAVQLVGKHVDATVNNPIEAESHWRAGKLRPLCVFDAKPMPYKAKLTATSPGPTSRPAVGRHPGGVRDAARHLHAPGVTPEQVEVLRRPVAKVRALPEWKEFMDKGAFNQTALTGQAYFDWVAATSRCTAC